LEFNVPFQHKYGYIRDETSMRTKLFSCLVWDLRKEQLWCRWDHPVWATVRLKVRGFQVRVQLKINTKC